MASSESYGTLRETPELAKPAWSSFLQDSYSRTPRYLFRVYDENSAGHTSTENVSSAQYRPDIHSESLWAGPHQAPMLCNHLLWEEPEGEGKHSNLVSWTSSLLFAVQLALFRHTNDMSKVFILVVDTQSFRPGTFIRDEDAMDYHREPLREFGYVYMTTEERQQILEAISRLNQLYQLRTRDQAYGYFFGEYLTEGRISVKGKCSQTSLQQLVDMGLYDFCPYFADSKHWGSLASRVVQIRKTYFVNLPLKWPGEGCYEPSEQVMIRKAIALVEACFGSKWTLPLAMMLLALAPASRVTNRFFPTLLSLFSDGELSSLAFSNFSTSYGDVIEVEDYRKMIRTLLKVRERRKRFERYGCFFNLR